MNKVLYNKIGQSLIFLQSYVNNLQQYTIHIVVYKKKI